MISKSHNRFYAPLLIALAGFAVYANSINGDFIYDDIELIRDNPAIKASAGRPAPARLLDLSSLNRTGSAERGVKSFFYRLGVTITYALDYFFWKLDVRGYHLSSILWHVLASLALYGLVNCLYRDRIAAFLAALFFAVHPAHTEAVAYISGRADQLFLFFMLSALIFYVRAAEKTGIAAVDSVGVAVCYAAALLCKEHALILAALAGLIHAVFRKKIKIGPAAAVALVTTAYLFYRLADYRLLAISHPYNASLAERLPGVFAALATYARLLVLPLGLHMEYGMRLFALSDPIVMAGLVLFFFLLNVLYVKRDSQAIFFSLSWFLIALIPVSNLFTLNAAMAEHWLYLPSGGIFMLAGLTAARGLGSNRRPITLAGVLATLTFFSVLTICQNETWRDAVRFYERTLRYSPRAFRIYNNLGVALTDRGKMEAAKKAFEKSVEINPQASESHFNLAYFYAIEGRTDEAIAAYEDAITLNPRYFMAYNNLGGIYEATGREEEALVFYRKALGINPQYALAARNLERLLLKRSPAGKTVAGEGS